MASTTYATIGIIIGIFEKSQALFPFFIILTTIVYAMGIWYGLKEKSGFFLSVIPFSLIVVTSALLIKIADGEMMFLFVCLFIIASVTLVIKNLVAVQKKWRNEN